MRLSFRRINVNNHSETVELIKSKLVAWGADHVTVVDNSHLHVGHEGAKSGGGHFAVQVTAKMFAGLSRIKSHRLVYQQLDDLFKTGVIHALEVEAILTEDTYE